MEERILFCSQYTQSACEQMSVSADLKNRFPIVTILSWCWWQGESHSPKGQEKNVPHQN